MNASPEETQDQRTDRLTEYYVRLASRHGARRVVRFLVSCIAHYRQEPPTARTLGAGDATDGLDAQSTQQGPRTNPGGLASTP